VTELACVLAYSDEQKGVRKLEGEEMCIIKCDLYDLRDMLDSGLVVTMNATPNRAT
jgi:hypothetical protein